jgi:hypothetical protein
MKKSIYLVVPFLSVAVSGLLVSWAPAPSMAAPANISVGSDGSDGPLSATSDMTIDLSLAPTGSWDTTLGTGNGVYDPAVWAVVFKYTTIDVQAGATVTFTNHPSRAPVVWLAQGAVNVSGIIDLSGTVGTRIPPTYAEPGPGGFRGGVGSLDGLNESAGFGPGGGHLNPGTNGGAGSYGATATGLMPGGTYGSGTVFPLIGGSGGAAGDECCFSAGGGGGGGAILMASDTLVHFQDGSLLRARGGHGGPGSNNGKQGGGASGGAIRIVSDTVQIDASAVLDATGDDGGGSSPNDGGAGRIRIEANQLTVTGQPTPAHTEGSPGVILPDLAAQMLLPTLYVMSIDDGVEHSLPSVLTSALESLNADVKLNTSGAVTVKVAATNIPVNTEVEVHVVPVRHDQDRQVYRSVFPHLTGPQTGLAVDVMNVMLPAGVSTIQLRAVLP